MVEGPFRANPLLLPYRMLRYRRTDTLCVGNVLPLFNFAWFEKEFDALNDLPGLARLN